MKVLEIDIEKVQQFSKRDSEYLLHSESFRDFIKYDFDYDSFPSIIENRLNHSPDRMTLHKVIESQYVDRHPSELTQKNIDLLQSNHTFTIITAHQPSLMTGPLYVPFKILSTICLTNQLAADHPKYNFVPVFITGGEDHDFDEINHIYIYGKRVEWKSDHQGSVGLFSLDGVSEAIAELKEILGERSKALELITKAEALLSSSKNYGEFSSGLIQVLFDHMGLVIVNMDDARLKSQFIPIIKKEITTGFSKSLIEETQKKIEAKGHSAQTHIRDINFFYRKGELRNRIEKEGDIYKVVDTDITFSEEAMIAEIENHPERFSPNVIMRPLYQELVFPNLAYIGGGGELAYWMERLTQFQSVDIPFPMLIRRTSGMITGESTMSQIDKLGLDINMLFEDEHSLIKSYLKLSEAPDFQLNDIKKEIENIYTKAYDQIIKIDKSLGKTTQAEKVKSIKSIEYLESKLKKSVKQSEEQSLNRIKKLTGKYFPSNGLQERHDNIIEYISSYGVGILDKLLEHCNPFDKKFKVFVMEKGDAS